MRESELLEHIYAANASLARHIVIPPGDDMGMLRLRGGGEVLVAVDQIVAGRHFDLAVTPIELVGRKAITRNLSDVAAMAARPLATLAAAALPPGFGQDRANALFDAMRATAANYGCPLMGGDIAIHVAASSPLTCAVTILAEPGPMPPVRRSGAKAGDALYVTGELGGTLEAGGLGRHLTFEPRVALALGLAERLRDRLHAMIDISDGLGRDGGHIATQSNVALMIEAARIPCRTGSDWRAALSGGEDYELCFAATGDVPTELEGVPITRIGEVKPAGSDGAGMWVRDAGGKMIDVHNLGWQHQSKEHG